LFFTTTQEAPLEPVLPELERLARRTDLVVAALSPEPAQRVGEFVKRRKPPFSIGIGAESRSYQQFRPEHWPSIVMIRPSGRVDQPAVDVFPATRDGLRRLMAMLGRPPADPKGSASTQAGPPDESASDDSLRSILRGDRRILHRRQALRLLRRRMPPAEFLALCDEMQALAGRMEVDTEADRFYFLGEIARQRHLADPAVVQKTPGLSPAERALRERIHSHSGSSPGVVLQPIDAAAIPARDVVEWRKASLALRTGLPEHLLSRLAIAEGLRNHPDLTAARALTLELIADEPDSAIRTELARTLRRICPVGDEEAARLLDEVAAREVDLVQARPAMQYAAYYLRTGVE
jgi:hypothetical protein